MGREQGREVERGGKRVRGEGGKGEDGRRRDGKKG